MEYYVYDFGNFIQESYEEAEPERLLVYSKVLYESPMYKGYDDLLLYGKLLGKYELDTTGNIEVVFNEGIRGRVLKDEEFCLLGEYVPSEVLCISSMIPCDNNPYRDEVVVKKAVALSSKSKDVY